MILCSILKKMCDCAIQENNHSCCQIYSHGLSKQDNSLLKYAFNSFIEKVRVASSLECGQSTKCRQCWLLWLAHTLKLHLHSIFIWCLWGYGLWISDLDRIKSLFFKERLCDLANYDTSSQHSVILCAFPYSLGEFSRTVFIKQ